MWLELHELDQSLNGQTIDQAVVGRRIRHLISMVRQILDEHSHPDGKRCPQRNACPADEILRCYVTDWLNTGGLADRREGDPAAVSTRRLL
jgi:hypothetical protein